MKSNYSEIQSPLQRSRLVYECMRIAGDGSKAGARWAASPIPPGTATFQAMRKSV